MHLKRTEPVQSSRQPLLPILLWLSVLIALSGCAVKPWRQPLAENGRSEVLQIMAEMRQEEMARNNCIDADVNMFFTSHFENIAISGYIQLMQPETMKYISSNPLGQPLVAFVSDGNEFQFINTMDQVYTEGDLATFARLHKIPPFVVDSSWGKWLTARLPAEQSVIDIRRDESQRGVWVTVASKGETEGSTVATSSFEHVLIDTNNKIILGRIFTTSSEKINARISYSNWLTSASDTPSLQPGQITISDLDYGGKLVLEFSDLQPMEFCSSKDFNLRRPAGYRYEPLPAQ